MSIPYLVFAR
jgi:hypothetical protein